MKNLMDIMQKANEIQKKIETSKEEFKSTEFSSSSGGGLVRVVINGDYEIKDVHIDDSIVSVEEKSMLVDLLIAAYNDAKAKAKQEYQDKIKEVTSGLPLPPGIKIPEIF